MTLEDLTHATLVDAPEAPIMTVRDMLRWAMRELAREGNAWVVDGEVATVSVDGETADLIAPADAEPVRLLTLKLDGRDMPPGGRYRQDAPSTATLTPPVDADALEGRLAVQPVVGTSLPEAIITTHAETLRHGALWRLLMMPQPWRDPETAMFHRRHWQAGITTAKQLASYGHQVGGPRMRMRRFI